MGRCQGSLETSHLGSPKSGHPILRNSHWFSKKLYAMRLIWSFLENQCSFIYAF